MGESMSDDLKVVSMKVGGGSILAFLFHLTMEQWIGVLTICYLLMQITILIPKYYAVTSSWTKEAWDFVKAKILEFLQ